MLMKKGWLVFVPWPTVGHLASTVEAAKHLLNRDDRLSIKVIIMKRSADSKLTNYADTLATTDRFRFVTLPMVDSDEFNLDFMKNHKAQIKAAVSNLISISDLPLAGFVLDMYCTSIMDVANEFGVPSYIFSTASAAFLGFMLHLQLLYDEQKFDPSQFMDSSDAELAVPTFVEPVPARVMPFAVSVKDWIPPLFSHTRRSREAKGIIVNSFMELESHAFGSLSEGKNPPVYPVGPILNLRSDSHNCNREQEIIDWLDDQPSSSVIFLCFGSNGSFDDDQVKEIACAVEHSGHRFLWSLRRPAPKDKMMDYPTDYENPGEVLPTGFLDRTAHIGKIVGWAPQTAILAHPAVGGFVSHCGWNSILESLWFGVPIATWPIYSEQQLNAFELVKELELGVEIKMDYKMDSGIVVKAEDIERGIRCVMEHDNKIRKKVKAMSEKSKKVLMDGGSSTSSLSLFIQHVMDNN